MTRHTLAILALSIFCATAKGQNTDLPPAPALPAAPAATAKPIFQVPHGATVDVASPEGMPPPKAAEDVVCYAPAEGLYAKHKALSPDQQRAVDQYLSIIFNEIHGEWDRHMPRAANDPWVRGKMVAVRFAIMPDGTTDSPQVTVASGRRSYDDHAVDAINAIAPFAPLPGGVKQPVPVCMKFGYNIDPSETKSKPLDLWPPPAKPQAPK